MPKSQKIAPIYSNEDFHVHACDRCGEDLVRFLGKWACRYCLIIPYNSIFGDKIAGMKLIEAFPNRAARRALGRLKI